MKKIGAGTLESQKRGFLLTIDGILALGILLIVLLLISNQIFQPELPRGVYLKQISLDVLKVLSYNGRINSALNGNTSAVREILEVLPSNVCMQLNLEDSINASTITIAKPGCAGFGNQLQTTYRTVVVGSNRYVARLESWFSN